MKARIRRLRALRRRALARARRAYRRGERGWAKRWEARATNLLYRIRRARRRYPRFDKARVTKEWYVLLTKVRERGWRGRLDGRRKGLRTYAMQAALWALFQAGLGPPAFPPNGPSRHMIRNVRKVGGWYMAVDTTHAADLVAHASHLGVRLHRPYGGEPWHVEAKASFRL